MCIALDFIARGKMAWQTPQQNSPSMRTARNQQHISYFTFKNTTHQILLQPPHIYTKRDREREREREREEKAILFSFFLLLLLHILCMCVCVCVCV